MILGRTSAGKIKIKTNSPLGLRAVECACCATGVCGCASMQPATRIAIEEATQISVNGSSQAWDGIRASYQGGFGELSYDVRYSNGILCVMGDDGNNTVFLVPVVGFCWGSGPPIDINGINYPAGHAFPFFQISLSIFFS